MSMCLNGENGNHAWEYSGTRDGGDYYLCLNYNCGETLFEPQDCLGG